MKMQTHLRHLRALAKASKLTTEQQQRFELATHMLWMNSRQRYVRDQFYRSYVAFSAGLPLKNRDITAVVRLKPLSKAERNKSFVIRGHSYNKFLWPTGPDFIPEGPFAALPRYVIRNRQKLNPDIDLKQTLPVVNSVVSVSASLMVASHAYDFYAAIRAKYSHARKIRRDIAKLEMQRNAAAQLALLRQKLAALADPDLRSAFWPPPVFTHGIHLITTNLDLHPHQVEGVSWLVHLFDHHVNAILADEVGLGKSLQVIAFIAFLKDQRRIPGPHLIAMPGSVLATWKDEFAKWLPGCSAICYYGKRTPRRNLFENLIARTEFEVLLVPYSILEKDAELLATVAWRVLVFDEGHRLKNPKTNVYKLVDDVYCADFRIITTATPFQNDLEELWSLLYLIAPQEFSSAEVWNLCFKDIEGSHDHELIEYLHGILRPYILRRVKSDLDFDIPSKLEVTLKCSPAPIQTEIIRRSLRLELDTGQKMVLSRKVSNSPALFLAEKPPIPWSISRSPKLLLLDRIISKLVITNHRFLIYSQWTSMMDVICDFLQWRRVEFLRIDGSVPTRRRLDIINQFTRPGAQFAGLVLSTRSSAFGLNLQVADTVVLFDSDYNPFVELQASSRVHRLGQVNSVVVIRLMMLKTGEEKILQVSRRKFVLGNEIIEGGRFNFRLNEEERKRAIAELSLPPPELVDPTDEELNSVLSRAQEDVGVMQFGGTGDEGAIQDEERFAEWDEKVLDSFARWLTGNGEESEREWEDIT